LFQPVEPLVPVPDAMPQIYFPPLHPSACVGDSRDDGVMIWTRHVPATVAKPKDSQEESLMPSTTIREQAELPPETAQAMEEIVEALRIVDRRLAALEKGGHKPPTSQMELPNRER
jgi:hypothetical protein